VSGTAESANYHNVNYDNMTSYTPNMSDATVALLGLSYVPTADASFQLKVKYIYSEKPTFSTNESSMDVQMQGFPSNEFTIVSASWNKATQRLEYELNITATSTSVSRVDGWNIWHQVSQGGGYTGLGTFLRRDGLSRSTVLVGSIPDFSDIEVKFVATRTPWLNSIQSAEPDVGSQREIPDGGGGVKDNETTKITILPATLRKPLLSDIALSNIIYDVNGPVNQNATLATTLPANVAGVRITNVSDSSTSTSNSFLIALSSVSTAMSFVLDYKYNSYVSGVLSSTYSDPVTLSFTTGSSNASIPVIVSKEATGVSTLTVIYTSSDASVTGGSNSLVSKMMVNVNSINGFVGNRVNSGSLALWGYRGNQVTLFIRNSFTCPYQFGSESGSSLQDIDRAGVLFWVAANPAIVESSIVVNSGTNSITFDVKNNGAPSLNSVLAVVSQDAGIADTDLGMYAVAMYTNSGGFAVGSTYTNVLSGGPAHTLTVTGITGVSYERVTSFRFNSVTDVNTTTANVLLHVANTTEGSDSSTVSVAPYVPPPIEEIYSGTLASNLRTLTMRFSVANNRNPIGNTSFMVENWTGQAANFTANVTQGEAAHIYYATVTTSFNLQSNIRTLLLRSLDGNITYSQVSMFNVAMV